MWRAKLTTAITKKCIRREHTLMAKAQVLLQLWQLLRTNKKYWLLPLILVLALTGVLLVATQGSALAPFIYSLF